MRIKNIELHNFGSYGGHNSFNFESDIPEERVVVIGGKNGTGKTTLFTAIQVCLYGNFAFGFKTAGKRYLNEIYNLINNQVRIDENESAFIEIGFQQVDNTDLFNYIIRRSWSWPQNDIQESLSVWQNGRQLEEDELLNFQNYLIHLIPPDMLKLYFFDGEKIADYFLGNKEVNIRDALMVLSGNDTFDILYDQVKRVLKISENAQSDVAHEYLTAQAEIEEYQQQVQDLQQDIESIQDSIEKLTAEIECHKKEYSDHGGITVEEWTDLHNQLKAEEEKRERLNWQRKAFATDSLPFVMLPELVNMVLPQMQAEKEHQTYDGSKSKRLEDRLMPEKQKKTIRELTLMLMYLTSWEERDTPEMRAVKKKELEKYPLVRRCWKGYDHDLLNKLSEEGLINAAGRTYPALITPEGEAEARKLLAQYGIDTEERRRCSAER